MTINIFRKKKQQETKTDLIPKGLVRSIIPAEYLDSVKQNNWDYNNPLFTNKIIIQNQ